MNNNGKQKKIIKRLIKEEINRAGERLGYINHLSYVCSNKGLTPEEFSFVHNEIWKGVKRTCEKRMKNTHLFEKKYKDEIKKSSLTISRIK